MKKIKPVFKRIEDLESTIKQNTISKSDGIHLKCLLNPAADTQ